MAAAAAVASAPPGHSLAASIAGWAPAWVAAGLLGLAAAGPVAAAAAAETAVRSVALAASDRDAERAQGETLPALLARTLEADPQVRVARKLYEAAGQRRLQLRSRLGPSITASATYGQSVDQELLGEIDRTTDRGEAGLRWNLYNQGIDIAEYRAAARDVQAAAQELRRAREETAERIAMAYAELWRLDQLLPRAAERLDALRRLAAQVQRQAELGKLADSEAQQAHAALLESEIVYEQLGADRASAQERLATLTGGPVRPTLPFELPPPGSLGLPAASRTGEATAALERAAAARERVRPVASIWAPRVDLEFRQRLYDNTRPRASTTETQQGWLLSARWDLPVLGELQARRQEGQLRAEAAEAEAERVQRTLEAELSALGPRIRQADRAVATLDRQIERYDALVRAGELQFEAGRRSLGQLMQLHDSRFSAEQRRSEQAHRLVSARLRRLALSGELLPALGQLPP